MANNSSPRALESVQVIWWRKVLLYDIWEHPYDGKYKAMVQDRRLKRQQGDRNLMKTSDKPPVVKGHFLDRLHISLSLHQPPDKSSDDIHTASESYKAGWVVSKTKETTLETKFKAMTLQDAKGGIQKGKVYADKTFCRACEHTRTRREPTQYCLSCKEKLYQACKESPWVSDNLGTTSSRQYQPRDNTKRHQTLWLLLLLLAVRIYTFKLVHLLCE